MQQATGLYHDIVASIVAALEAKDRFTADHSQRVSDLTVQTCVALGLTNEQTELIHMAAHVHDIGKIGVPDAVLTKPGALDAVERALIREHPRLGADILGQTPELCDIAEIVLHHHEQWNGLGYPSGLKGTDIPLGSRIIRGLRFHRRHDERPALPEAAQLRFLPPRNSGQQRRNVRSGHRGDGAARLGRHRHPILRIKAVLC